MKSKVLSIPYLLWMAFFTLAPLAVVVFFALTDRTGAFTLHNIFAIQGFLPIFINSVLLALIASLICLAIGYPVAYYMSRVTPARQRFLIMLVMLPMCMSFLLRTMALVALLGNTGIINHLLGQLGIGPLPLIRNNGAVIFGMVYNFLPYVVLPLYSVMVKIDPRLIEAAQDLGCDSRQVFTKVIFPLSKSGVISGFTMVFVPAVSTFYISKKLGGTNTALIGDVIEAQFKNSVTFNSGAAISLALMILVLFCVFIMNYFTDDDENEVMLL